MSDNLWVAAATKWYLVQTAAFFVLVARREKNITSNRMGAAKNRMGALQR